MLTSFTERTSTCRLSSPTLASLSVHGGSGAAARSASVHDELARCRPMRASVSAAVSSHDQHPHLQQPSQQTRARGSRSVVSLAPPSNLTRSAEHTPSTQRATALPKANTNNRADPQRPRSATERVSRKHRAPDNPLPDDVNISTTPPGGSLNDRLGEKNAAGFDSDAEAEESALLRSPQRQHQQDGQHPPERRRYLVEQLPRVGR